MARFDPKEHSHRRYDPLRDQWILVSPHRTKRPWAGQVEKPPEENIPRHSMTNPLCPRATRSNGEVNPDYESVFIFPNDFPALLKEGPIPENSDDPIFKSEKAYGNCQVMCFHPWSDITLPLMQLNEIRCVIDKWSEITKEEGKQYSWVQIFENRGAIMGCSNPHPHCQIWSTSYLPNEPTTKDRTQLYYYKKHGRPLLVDYVEQELTKKERIVIENESWVWLVPYWAVWPYETMLLPKKHTLRLQDLSDQQRNEAHVTITHDALDINVEGPMALALSLPSGHQKWDLSHPPLPQACALLMKPDGQHWRPVQTCSLEGPLIWGHGAVRTGWYASYWNAFLLFISSSCYISLNTGFYLCFLLLTSCRKSLI